MSITVSGRDLNIEKMVHVARAGEEIELAPEAIERIKGCREIVDRMVERKATMYGVTTGIGELSEVVLSPEQVRDFQKYLIYSHAAGCGEPVATDDVRASILSRINVLCRGHSGPRPVVVDTLVEMLNKGVTPVMCQKGSVGASGDLSPMGQMALVLMGEGEAFFKGERLSGADAMKRAGVSPLRFEARDGLAVINGSNVTAGMGSLQIHDAGRLFKTSEIAAAMSLDVLNANMQAYDERIHKARGYAGAVASSSNVRRMTEGGDFLRQSGKRVQDAYSLRSTPQVMGAARDTLDYARRTFEVELNGVGDNPLFFADDGGTVITGANFQGTPLAFALDYLGIAVTTVCVISERRLNRLVNPNLSAGLPPFLTKGAGMFSGMMLAQYTADSMVCENRILSGPASVGSIPAAADQEDFVSMSMTSAVKSKQILSNACTVLAIELMAGAQALDFRKPLKPGPGVAAAYDVVRRHVQFLEEDRPLHGDINRLSEVVRSGEILDAVEKAVGSLE
jgi:histidine ammonia-lyase